MTRRLKRALSHVPGSVETYKLSKNLLYRTRLLRETEGGIKGGGFSHDQALSYVRRIFEKVERAASEIGGVGGKRVLEIGPGDSLGVGLLAIAKGADRYCAIDRFSVRFDLAAERLVFVDLLESLSAGERQRVAEVIEITRAGYRSTGDRFTYFNSMPIEEAPARFPRGGFDLIFSNAVLEHVSSVRGSLGAMRDLLAPGGLMTHDVDLRSHQRFEKHDLHFLEYSSRLWRTMTSHTGEPNRTRLPGYRHALDELGFRNVRVDVLERFDAGLVRRVRPRLCPEFGGISEEDLAVAVFRVTALAPS